MSEQSIWDYSIFWNEVVSQFKTNIRPQEYNMWIDRIFYVASREQVLYLGVPSEFYRKQILQRYSAIIKEKLLQLMGEHISIIYEVIPPYEKHSPSHIPKEVTITPISADPEYQLQQQKAQQSTTQHNENELHNNAQSYTTNNTGNYTNTNNMVENVRLFSSPYKEQEVQNTTSIITTKRDLPFNHNLHHPKLKSEYTFDHYIIGDNNLFAGNAAQAISKQPGTMYNPCLIYGGVGLGKTHMLHAIGHEIFKNSSGQSKIIYVSMENFTNEFITSIREKKQNHFKNKYRNTDVLLIDDIHFLQNKHETQEELFHTFNALYEANKQMVFTCDRPITELQEITDRLRSRFERGLNMDLQPPSYETRCAIIKNKINMSAYNEHISEEIIQIICNNVTTNIRDLEAALMRITAYVNLVGGTITTDIVYEQLKDFFNNNAYNKITIASIQQSVAEYFALSVQDLKNKKKNQAIVHARHIAMYISREYTEHSTTEIGLEFGGRDHTTVMHAHKKICKKITEDYNLINIINALVRIIKERSMHK